MDPHGDELNQLAHRMACMGFSSGQVSLFRAYGLGFRVSSMECMGFSSGQVLCMYVCVCVCMYLCMYVCMHVCM